MPCDADAESWIALSLIPDLGGQYYRKLLAAFGAPEVILTASRSELEGVVSARVAQNIRVGGPRGEVQVALEWLNREDHHLLTLADGNYPQQLLEITDPPPLLYVIGQRELLGRSALAIVGSRSATPQGVDHAEAFARAVSEAGLTVVSGLAEGIDAAAHRGGLVGASSSIAVVGTGLDRIYPVCNRDLANDLANRGALISEFPLGTRAMPGNFPRRNRIISGLSRGVLVVEAGLQSGSLITARCALDQGREVFAVPGSIHSPLAKGCHALIKQGAKLVEIASDILEELGMLAATSPSATGSSAADHGLLAAVGYDPCDLDTVCARSGLMPEQMLPQLLELELQGEIIALPGGLFQRRRS